MFQKNAFQPYAFQFGLNRQTEEISAGYVYYHPSQYRNAKDYQQVLRKQKTELQKLESVLKEYQRRESLAEESLRVAEESERNRLLKIQNDIIAEINRLLMVKAGMMARIKRNEEIILRIVLRRKRLRAF